MNEQSDRSSLVAEDHDGVRRRLYTMPIETRVFAVISWGCAATRWLAKALNSHPEILCIHNANQLWRRWTGGEQADEWTYLRFVAHLGRGYSAAGDVHGVVRSEVPRLRETLGPLFNAAVVVREPLARVRSQMALFDHMDGVRAWDLRYIDAVAASKNVTLADGDLRGRMFVHAANMLNAVSEEQQAGKIYRAEDLIGQAGVLAEFVEEITRGSVAPHSSWVEHASALAVVNPHRNGERLQFGDWHIDVLRKVVAPGAWEIYAALGYPAPEFL